MKVLYKTQYPMSLIEVNITMLISDDLNEMGKSGLNLWFSSLHQEQNAYDCM